MAVGDTIEGGVRLRKVSPPRSGDVRHFDQLSDDEQDAFLRLYRGEGAGTVPLDVGEVVVFTDYYRVER